MAAFWAVNAMACMPPARFGPDRQEVSWPAYLGNARHDASVAESLNPDPRPLWHTGVGRAVRGAPALGETVLAVGTVDRTVVLVNRESGELLWRSRLGGTIHGGPLLDEDRLYVATEASPEGRVYALRLRTGRPVWTAKTDGVEAPLAFDGDALYAGTERGTVLRLDPETGTIRWRRRLAGAIRAAPVPSASGLAVATDADTLYLLSRETGEIQRRLPTAGAVLSAPALGGGGGGVRLYLGTTEGHVLAVDLPALSVAWDHPSGDAVYGAPALVQDTLYVLARNGRLWIIPTGAPAAARSFELGIVATAGPTPVGGGEGGGVIVASVSGEVLLVSRADGSISWRARVDGPVEEPPLVRDRQLVVIAGRGDIQVYR